MRCWKPHGISCSHRMQVLSPDSEVLHVRDGILSSVCTTADGVHLGALARQQLWWALSTWRGRVSTHYAYDNGIQVPSIVITISQWVCGCVFVRRSESPSSCSDAIAPPSDWEHMIPRHRQAYRCIVTAGTDDNLILMRGLPGHMGGEIARHWQALVALPWCAQ
ncbi:hypothetical protein K431DRAFT_138600 [Polychaeton citri CBS 116435]|uniref:Uncharacterized protein n=1 Tax=Polychaeton citri CBS 116435 TaxID=1314669 RepID=A0A9P4Q2G2_9PEZI|nr:hypothetical protein K431DRAFT_138600 [Polychaeton citri CBS 116435]